MINKPGIRTTISVIKGDITTLEADIVVNSTNSHYLGAVGVDRAIHMAAGPRLRIECEGMEKCPIGEVKITKAYDLNAQHIVHTVGPVWRGGNYNEDLILANCYEKCLKIGRQYKAKSIAFPNISTGPYGVPKPRACNIAFSMVNQYLLYHPDEYRTIYFVCYEEENFNIYSKYNEALKKSRSA